MAERADIPERFDEQRPCPKCWWSPVTVKHCTQRYAGGYGNRHEVFPVDHLHRECGRCGYTWLELPWDALEYTSEEWARLVAKAEDDALDARLDRLSALVQVCS